MARATTWSLVLLFNLWRKLMRQLPNKTLQLTGRSLRSRPAAERGRWAT